MNNKKLKIVLSGVNIIDAGQLQIFRYLLNAFLKRNVEIICLVNSKSLFDEKLNDQVTFIEYPQIKESWIKRIIFEYFSLLRISKKIDSDIWINMQDTSARVYSYNSFVYCHNPSMFGEKKLWHLFYDWKFFIWTYLYKYLFRINIKSNRGVIVQQEWIAEEFKKLYKIDNTIVAKPIEDLPSKANNDFLEKLVFVYPSISRLHKNFEVILKALEYIDNNYPSYNDKIFCSFTFNKNENRWSRYLYKNYKKLKNVEFTGYMKREDLIKKMENSTIGVFPSKLETWGLPITEFKQYRLPIILSDLKYAHETLGNYSRAIFINPDDFKGLAKIFMSLLDGDDLFYKVEHKTKNRIINNWDELVDEIFKRSRL